MNRKTALELAKIAGYHEDTKAGTRILLESRLNRKAYDQAFNKGREMKQTGVPCSCNDCNRKKPRFEPTQRRVTNRFVYGVRDTVDGLMTLETLDKDHRDYCLEIWNQRAENLTMIRRKVQ